MDYPTLPIGFHWAPLQKSWYPSKLRQGFPQALNSTSILYSLYGRSGHSGLKGLLIGLRPLTVPLTIPASDATQLKTTVHLPQDKNTYPLGLQVPP